MITKKELKKKKAIKTIKFWFDVMLTTSLMNEPDDRLEMLQAIKTITKK